jgi:hypothetical protein
MFESKHDAIEYVFKETLFKFSNFSSLKSASRKPSLFHYFQWFNKVIRLGAFLVLMAIKVRK